MKILFIYARPDLYKKPRFGFSYQMVLYATLVSYYHEISIKDYSVEPYSAQDVVNIAESKLYDMVFVECDSYALKRSQNIINARDIFTILKDKVVTIAYGNYCCITKKDFLPADITICNNNINSIIDTINGFSGINKISMITSYDKLPHIDRTLLNGIEYFKKNKINTLLQTSMGCMNSCVFCQRKGWQREYISHSDEYIVAELEIIKKQGYSNIWISDENFTYDLARSKRLLTRIIESNSHAGLNFFISSWANITKEFLDLAKKCNIKIISLGIESANKNILNFYKKHINIESIPNIIQYANEIGIFTVGNFILGAPMETETTIKETFDLIEKCCFDQINIKTLDYMIGSEMYESLPNSLKFDDHIFASKENGLTSFSIDDLVIIKEDFKKKYYKNHQQKLSEKIQKFGHPYIKF